MSCMPARYNFDLYEGVNCKILQTTNGENLTGATIQFTASKTVNSKTPEISIAGVIDDATTGKYHIPITPSDTDGLATEQCVNLYYDVLITKQDGSVEADTCGMIKLFSKVEM